VSVCQDGSVSPDHIGSSRTRDVHGAFLPSRLRRHIPWAGPRVLDADLPGKRLFGQSRRMAGDAYTWSCIGIFESLSVRKERRRRLLR